MPRKQKKYHYIYRTTCVVTGKFYVGMHSTDDLSDGYLGSGKILGYSLNKHGRENHKLEVLEMCGSREQLRQREKEIVNEALLAHPLNINLKYGGEGGGQIWNEEHARKFHRAGWEAMNRIKDFSAASKRGHTTAAARGTNRRDFNGEKNPMFGKLHNAAAKDKMTASHLGCRNHNFGKRNACVSRSKSVV